jgi:hypothetical protein
VPVSSLHEVHGHHDHPGDPEENDVEAGDQHIGWVEGFQIRGVLRPAEGGERPQRRREPGIEYIFVLTQSNFGHPVDTLTRTSASLRPT